MDGSETSNIEGSLDVETAHSQEEDLHDGIPILDTVVNRF